MYDSRALTRLCAIENILTEGSPRGLMKSGKTRYSNQFCRWNGLTAKKVASWQTTKGVESSGEGNFGTVWCTQIEESTHDIYRYNGCFSHCNKSTTSLLEQHVTNMLIVSMLSTWPLETRVFSLLITFRLSRHHCSMFILSKHVAMSSRHLNRFDWFSCTFFEQKIWLPVEWTGLIYRRNKQILWLKWMLEYQLFENLMMREAIVTPARGRATGSTSLW